MINIEIYTKETCPYCHHAKKLITSKGVPFKEFSIENNADLKKEMINRSGSNTVPQIFINGNHIGGCDDLYALNTCGDLDAMLK